MDFARVEPLEVRKDGDFGLERIECHLLVLTSVDEHRHAMAERDIGEGIRRTVEETAARKRQRPNQPVAKRIMDHGRASARGMEPDLLLGLEHGYASVRGQ